MLLAKGLSHLGLRKCSERAHQSVCMNLGMGAGAMPGESKAPALWPLYLRGPCLAGGQEVGKGSSKEMKGTCIKEAQKEDPMQEEEEGGRKALQHPGKWLSTVSGMCVPICVCTCV